MLVSFAVRAYTFSRIIMFWGDNMKKLKLFIGILLCGSIFLFAEKETKSDSNFKISQKLTTGINFVYVEGGTFTMGSIDGEALDPLNYDYEKPLHDVTLNSFKMLSTEVTQGLFEAVMGYNGSYYTGGSQGWKNHPNPAYSVKIKYNKAYYKGLSKPVECVTWYKAVVFCNRWSVLEGLTPCYSLNGSVNPDDWGTYELNVPGNSMLGTTWDIIECNWEADGFRLPTEAEWEYAARGGKYKNPYKYSGSNKISEVAWYRWNSSNQTHKVAAKKPNALGIYDMTGNVCEWCWDWDYYGNPYPETPQNNPTGPEKGPYRIRRGGCYADSFKCKVSARDCWLPFHGSCGLGFRVVSRYGNFAEGTPVIRR